MSDSLDLAVFECPLCGHHLVEASAGTGKTWNLCALFVRLLIEQSHPIEQILVVTFTQAATAELRERIRARLIQCREALGTDGPLAPSPEHPEPLVRGLLERFDRQGIPRALQAERLDTALAHFDEASIFTIHGFCQRALADAPFSARQALQMTVLQDDHPLIEEVVYDFWRTEVLSAQAPRPLVEAIHRGKRRPEVLIQDLRSRLARPTARMIWPEAPSPSDTSAPPLAATPGKSVEAALQAEFAGLRELWSSHRVELLEALAADRPLLHLRLTKNGKLDQAVQHWLSWLAQADPLAPVPDAEQVKALKVLSRSGYIVRKGHAPRFRAEALDLAEQILDQLAHREAQGEWLWSDLRQRAVATLPDQLQHLKRSRQVLGYSDMLGRLHQRLTDPETAQSLAVALRTRFPVALVDEFQDTDPLQFEIIQKLYPPEHGSLFLLGDPKQAIYSFRNADLHTYLTARAGVEHRHTLRHNQRASPALIDAINHFFSHNPQAFLLPGIHHISAQVGDRPREAFMDQRALHDAPHRDRLAPMTLWSLPEPEDKVALEHPQAQALAAQLCAREIASLMRGADQGTVTLNGKPLKGSDIAVLVRRHREGEWIRRELLALGVSSVSITQDSVYASVDALELEQVLRAVLAPSDLALLRVALSTDLIGETAPGLLALEHDDELLAQWSLRFHEWAQEWLRRGIGAMLRRLMRDLGVLERWLTRTDGQRRLTNLLHLIELLQGASRQQAHPQALLEFLTEERLHGQTSESAGIRLESDQDLVRILTIHKSKGLEFPVVFCPFLWSARMAGATKDVGPGAHYHDAEGHPLIDQRRTAERADQQKSIQRAIRLEQAAEHVRLIYVALTRAKHRLVLITGQALGGRRTEAPNARADSGAATVLQWIIAGASAPLDHWLDGVVDAQAVLRHWTEWAKEHPQAIHSGPAPALEARPLQRTPHLRPETIVALPPPPRVVPNWRLGSYSSLVHGVSSDQGEIDLDQRARIDPYHLSEPSMPPDDPLLFPRGAQAGVCIHALLESIDFQDPSAWPRWIERALTACPPQSVDPRRSHLSARWPDQLAQLLNQCLRTPLAPGFRMADIPAAHRLNELEFTLKVSRLNAQPLQRLLGAHGSNIQLPAFETLRGYLRGFIDLVFMHDGRYFVLDWKSNHLGVTPANYFPESLQRAMADNHYDFQALLYECALHRYLKLRLRHYDPARHLGGSLYLFVRGVRPDWTTPEGHACGVHHQGPDVALILAMDRLLGPDPMPSPGTAWPAPTP